MTSFQGSSLEGIWEGIGMQSYVIPTVSAGVCQFAMVSDKSSRVQLNVYFTAQAVYQAFEGLFGGVKVLPGAFCLLRYTAVEALMAEYSLLPSEGDIQAANELELGEDRFMTCLFLEHGWDVLYEPDAKAG